MAFAPLGDADQMDETVYDNADFSSIVDKEVT